jgi:hypothetical protein
VLPTFSLSILSGKAKGIFPDRKEIHEKEASMREHVRNFQRMDEGRNNTINQSSLKAQKKKP